LILALYEHRDGVETGPGNRVVYSVDRSEAFFGAAAVAGHALRWELAEEDEEDPPPKLSAGVGLDPSAGWLMRCDRVDFPPGGIAYRHTHPGPGIRRLLHGELTIETADGERTYGAGGAWFEGADFPVLATASASEETAFVRVMLLPREWEGRRTIRYVDRADEEKPRLQRATILLEQPIEL
jgi:quercetin dioxygenase-like cupin family protein